ncbi:hypothetical protein ACFX19_027948 [Malus domestica]
MSGVGPVLAAEHPKRELRVVHHRAPYLGQQSVWAAPISTTDPMLARYATHQLSSATAAYRRKFVALVVVGGGRSRGRRRGLAMGPKGEFGFGFGILWR